MISKPTLQSLPLECLLEIVKYVPLPECMFLRSSCASLKYAVEEHFRCDVHTLPVMLSDHYSPESVKEYQQHFENANTKRHQKISFGSASGVSQWNLWEDTKMLNVDRNRHFRRDNYLILTDLTKFGVFVDFVTKYLPRITKLALVVDHLDHAHNIPAVMNIYQKQLKVLLLERTLRAGIVFYYNDALQQVVPAANRQFNFTREFYDSIDNLEALEELYFFSKCIFTFSLGAYRQGDDYHFVESMFHKLKVFHLNCDFGRPFNFRSEIYEKLEELACYSGYSFRENALIKASFPRLEKIIFLKGFLALKFRLDSDLLPSLRDISLPNCWVNFIGNVTQTMNSFPNLKRLHCYGISLAISHHDKVEWINRTVEFVEIDKLFHSYSNYSMENAMQKAREFLNFFPNLKKAVIREPFMELTGNDLSLEEAEAQ